MHQKFSCIYQRTTTNHRSPLFFILKIGGKWCAFRGGLGKLQKQIRFWSLIKNTPTKRLSHLEKSRLTEKTYSHAPIKTLIEMLVHQQPINVQHVWDPRALNETGLWIVGQSEERGLMTVQLGASWHNQLNNLEKTDTLTASPAGPSFPAGPSGPVKPWREKRSVVTVVSSIENKQIEDAVCMWCVDNIMESVCWRFRYTYINSW